MAKYRPGIDPIKTIEQARAYVAHIEAITGKRHKIFQTNPDSSAAVEFGILFGTCEDDEIEDYRASGAVFVE